MKNTNDNSKLPVPATNQGNDYSVVLASGADIVEAIKENMSTEVLTQSHLEKIRVPSGGGLSWSVPTEHGEEEAKTFNGIIIHVQLVKSYWSRPIGEGDGNLPPDCLSLDGITGIGSPGGPCDKCTQNQWGSGRSSRSKACGEKRVLYILRPGAYLPTILRVPAGSLQAFTSYLFKLSMTGKKYSSVITTFGLEKDKNATGQVFSKITFHMAEALDAELAAKVTQYKNGIVPCLDPAFEAGMDTGDAAAHKPEQSLVA